MCLYLSAHVRPWHPNAGSGCAGTLALHPQNNPCPFQCHVCTRRVFWIYVLYQWIPAAELGSWARDSWHSFLTDTADWQSVVVVTMRLSFPVRNVMYIPVSPCHLGTMPSRYNAETTHNLESTVWCYSSAGFIRTEPSVLRLWLNIPLVVLFPAQLAPMSVFIIQKLVESWDSLVALTAVKGLKFHPCLEVNVHGSATRSESSLVGCFQSRNGNSKLSWDFVLQVFPGGQRGRWW